MKCKVDRLGQVSDRAGLISFNTMMTLDQLLY